MSLFTKLFGGGKAEPEPEIHNGYRIYPAPAKESGGYRLQAGIEKEIDGETRTHQLIRADTISDLEQANQASVAKAKQIIDEQGDRLFG